MRRWLARFSFSLVIVGAVLLFEAFRTRPITPAKQRIYAIAGALCLGLGMAGVRERHRNS